MKKISVIVPIYNAESTIERCVESILCQTHTNLQVILVNDGSTDHSLEICSNLASRDSRIELLNVPNGGVSSARNHGLERIEGEYFTFVDSDDRLAPSAYEEMLSEMEISSCDIVFCKTIHVKNETELPVTCGTHPCNTLLNLGLIDAWNNSMEGGIWSALYRTALFQEIRFDSRLRFGEDRLYLMDCLVKNPKAVLLDRHLYYYTCDVDFLKKYFRTDYIQQCILLTEECNERFFAVNQIKEAAAVSYSFYDSAAKAVARDKSLVKTYRESLDNFSATVNTKQGYRSYCSLIIKNERFLRRQARRFATWLIHKKWFGLYRCFYSIMK